MKQFNLERALAGDPVGTRDGEHKAVHIFHADKGAENCKVIAVFDRGGFNIYYENGRRYTEKCPGDLVMLPKTKTYWYAICRSKGAAGTYRYATALFEDKEYLLKSIDGNKIIRILSTDIEEDE